jgi:glycosyltransferase involved in cell wall biosynthesis
MSAEVTSSSSYRSSTASSIEVAIVAPSLAILGGQAVQARRLIDAWKNDRDVHAWLVPINPQPRGWLQPLMKVKFVRTVLTQLMYWPLLVRELARADLVHVFSASYASFLLAPLPAVLIARLLGKRVLLNYHSGEAPDHLRRSRLARRILRSVDLNIVPSRFLQDVFDSNGIASRVIPNIIDRTQFRFRLRDHLLPRIISTRNLEPLYNVACTVRAFARVQRRYPDASLILVGGGSEESPLLRLVENLGLRNVTFVGRVPPDEIWRLYDQADIYVQTPNIDNMPLSIVEAYASGLPVVSTEAGGVPSMLTDGTHGLLAPLDDDERVATHIERLLADPALGPRLTRAAFKLTDNLSWDRVREQWIAAYEASLADGVAEPSMVRPI